ncbi:hypothetical protein FQN50_000924 [Emmonsiellopsis sp. PD_5]|nr:hypothetical protein FQN50_000924 [Emmonsiellopsis sp. PD_5]
MDSGTIPKPTRHPKSLGELSVDVVLTISDHFPESDLNNVAQTCQDLRSILNPILYRRDAHSNSPKALFWAAKRGRVATARLALANGANIHAISKSIDPDAPQENLAFSYLERTIAVFSLTPLQIAICHGQESMVKFLVRKGADFLSPISTAWGETPLHVASRMGPLGILKFLLERGAEVDALDTWGRTPLYYAVHRCRCRNKYEGTRALRVRCLLDYNADPNVESNDGKTPRQVAERSSDPLVQKIFCGGKESSITLHEAALRDNSFRTDTKGKPQSKEKGRRSEKNGTVTVRRGFKQKASPESCPGPVPPPPTIKLELPWRRPDTTSKTEEVSEPMDRMSLSDNTEHQSTPSREEKAQASSAETQPVTTVAAKSRRRRPKARSRLLPADPTEPVWKQLKEMPFHHWTVPEKGAGEVRSLRPGRKERSLPVPGL